MLLLVLLRFHPCPIQIHGMAEVTQILTCTTPQLQIYAVYLETKINKSKNKIHCLVKQDQIAVTVEQNSINSASKDTF